jgi:hypothetical protein
VDRTSGKNKKHHVISIMNKTTKWGRGLALAVLTALAGCKCPPPTATYAKWQYPDLPLSAMEIIAKSSDIGAALYAKSKATNGAAPADVNLQDNAQSSGRK